MSNTQIESVRAREVLDSRGNPTVEVDVKLAGGAFGSAIVPSGASTGAHEVLELRDGDARFGGKGVQKACANVDGPLADAVKGLDATDIAAVDGALRAADGTGPLEKYGANAVLGISLASAHAAAAGVGQPLFRFLGDAFGGQLRMPVPMFNVLNGGAHADNGLDVQEVMIAPAGLGSFREALRAGAEIYQVLKSSLAEKKLSTAVGDEGGFAPHVESNEQAVDLVSAAIEAAGYAPGEQVLLALDVAATEFLGTEGYRFDGENLSAAQMTEVYERWTERYPIYSIEDGLGEDDWAGWQAMTKDFSGRIQLVGDDLFVTNTERLSRGITEGVANAVLVKPNQIGTLTDTFTCVQTAYDAGFGAVMSHRSGETEDTTIADLAVAMGTGQIKTGAPCRGERTAKYNRLLRIAEALADEGIPYGFRTDVGVAAPTS